MLTVFFAKDQVIDYRTALRADTSLYARFFQRSLEREVYLPPSQFEASFVSAAHSDADIQRTIQALSRALSLI